MPTKKELVDDIILRVTKGQPSDDLELEPSQVAFWFDLIAKELVPNYLNSKIKKDEELDSILINTEDDLVGTVEDVAMLDQYSDRVYIEVEEEIIDLKNDNGLVRIITEEGLVVNKVSLAKLDTLNAMTFSRPNRENLLHTRINQRIYIHGLSPLQVNLTKFSVWYIPKPNFYGAGDDDIIKLPEDLLNMLSDAVEEKAMRELRQVEPDMENDGQDDNNPK